MRAAVEMALRGRGTPVPFDAASRLVTTGPYGVVRNPMAVSAVLQSAGVALLRRSPSAVLVPVGAALLWQVVLRPAEESFLRSVFGEAFEDYRRAVPLWLPRPDPARLRRRCPRRFIGTAGPAGARAGR